MPPSLGPQGVHVASGGSSSGGENFTSLSAMQSGAAPAYMAAGVQRGAVSAYVATGRRPESNMAISSRTAMQRCKALQSMQAVA
jgi:hypothetical protein